MFGPLTRAMGLGLALAFLAVGCGEKEEEPDKIGPKIGRVEIVNGADELAVGSTLELGAKAYREDGTTEVKGRSFSWISSRPQIAKVDGATGRVEALRVGQVTISAMTGGQKAELHLDVIAAPIDRIVIDPADLELEVGKGKRLLATAVDANGNTIEGLVATWSSSDVEVATVDAEGTVVAVGAGEATVAAVMGEKQGEVVVRVVEIPAASIFVSRNSLNLVEHAVDQINAEARDEQGRPIPNVVTLTSADPSIVSVEQSGRVLALRYGDTTIVAQSGEAQRVITVHVSQLLAAEVVVEAMGTEVDEGKTLQVAAKIYDDKERELTGRKITWTSSAPTLASIDANGLVSGHLPGTVVLTATVDSLVDGSIVQTTGTLSLPVNAAIDSITFGTTPALLIGQTWQMEAILLDARGDEVSNRRVTWQSFDTNIATVADGVVTAISEGDVQLQATADGVVGLANVKVAAELRFSEVSAGGATTCAIAQGGAPWCWGTLPGKSGFDSTSAIPVRITGANLASVSVGLDHVCGLNAAGAAFCAGQNGTGQLGDSTFSARTNFVPVGGGKTFRTILAGAGHTCAIDMAGQAWCWGANLTGQLGTGNKVQATTPAQVAGGHTFASLHFSSAGNGSEATSCALTAAGEAYCWGDNSDGQFGDGTTTSSDAPVRAGDGRTFEALSVSTWVTHIRHEDQPDERVVSAHACGVSGGALFCWGDNTHGQLGDGTTDSSLEPVSVALSGVVALGTSATVETAGTCARTATNELFCWGSNVLGQFGDGMTDSSLEPVVAGGGASYTAVSVGMLHVCGIGGGKLSCWGSNGSHQIGSGNDTDSSLLDPHLVIGQK